MFFAILQCKVSNFNRITKTFLCTKLLFCAIRLILSINWSIFRVNIHIYNNKQPAGGLQICYGNKQKGMCVVILTLVTV